VSRNGLTGATRISASNLIRVGAACVYVPLARRDHWSGLKSTVS
jgi:hypothetical protein